MPSSCRSADGLRSMSATFGFDDRSSKADKQLIIRDRRSASRKSGAGAGLLGGADARGSRWSQCRAAGRHRRYAGRQPENNRPCLRQSRWMMTGLGGNPTVRLRQGHFQKLTSTERASDVPYLMPAMPLVPGRLSSLTRACRRRRTRASAVGATRERPRVCRPWEGASPAAPGPAASRRCPSVP